MTVTADLADRLQSLNALEAKFRLGRAAPTGLGSLGSPDFDPSDHPRDYRGRFIDVGSDVTLPDGRSARVTSVDGGRIRTDADDREYAGGTLERTDDSRGPRVVLPDGRSGTAESSSGGDQVDVLLDNGTVLKARISDLHLAPAADRASSRQAPGTPDRTPDTRRFATLTDGISVQDGQGRRGTSVSVDDTSVVVRYPDGDVRTIPREEVQVADPEPDSPFASPFDERLVNYKPDRNLADASQVARLDELLPNAEYQAYSDVPFLDEMHRQMGVDDPMAVSVADYLAARDTLFNSLPVVDVPFDQVVVTQPGVNKGRVQQIIDQPETGGSKPQHFVRYKGKTYVMNGHHRVAAQIQQGDTSAKGRVLDLDAAGFSADADDPFKASGPDAPDLRPGLGQGAVATLNDGHWVFVADASHPDRLRVWDDDGRKWREVPQSEVDRVIQPAGDERAAGIAREAARRRSAQVGDPKPPRPPESPTPVDRVPLRSTLSAPVDVEPSPDALGDGNKEKARYTPLFQEGLNGDDPEVRAVAAKQEAAALVADRLTAYISDEDLAADRGMDPAELTEAANWLLTPSGMPVRAKELDRGGEPTSGHQALLDGGAVRVTGADPRLRAGLRREYARQNITSWARTSGDSNTRAIALQRSAADLFQLEGVRDFYVAPAVSKQADALREREDRALTAFLRAQYDETQTRLRAQGIDTVRAYRGMRHPKDNPPPWGRTPAPADLQLRALNSFTIDPARAREFATEQNTVGTVTAIDVPADRVVAMPRTGQGSLSEWEVVVAGGTAQGYVMPIGTPVEQPAGKPRTRPERFSDAEEPDRAARLAQPPRSLRSPTGADEGRSGVDEVPDSPDHTTAATPVPPLGDPETVWDSLRDPGTVDLLQASPWLYKGLPDRAGDGTRTTEADIADRYFTGQERVDAKAAVVADLTGRMASVPDEQMFAFTESTAYYRRLPYGGYRPVDATGDAARSNPDLVPADDPGVRDWRRESAVNMMVAAWAETSNGTALATAMQRAAQAEFDLDVSEHPDVPDRVKAEADALFAEREEALRGFIRAQYAATQEMFAREGIREVTVYRGMAWQVERGEVAPSWVDDEDTAVSLSAMSSFSVDPAEARRFAVNGAGGEGQGKPVVLAASIPVERVLGTPRTGVGCLPEYEVVVLGGSRDRFTLVKPHTPPPLTYDQVADGDPALLVTTEDFQRAIEAAATDERRQALIERSMDRGGWGAMIPRSWRGENDDPARYDPEKDNRPPVDREQAQIAARSLPADQIGTATQFVDAMMDWFLSGAGGSERERELIDIYRSGRFTVVGLDPPANWLV